MITTLICDPKTGLGFASGIYSALPTLAANEVECNAGQAANPGAWKLAGTVLVPAASADMAPSLALLATRLKTAASDAAIALTRQIVPDQAHQNAYLNAAAIVGPASAVPTVEPAKTSFAALAAANGAQPQQFATLVVGIAAASFALSAALTTVNAAAAAATSTAQLASAKSAFDAAAASVASAIGSAGVAVTAPAPLAVTGLNP